MVEGWKRLRQSGLDPAAIGLAVPWRVRGGEVPSIHGVGYAVESDGQLGDLRP
jgi:hypothetical protein